MVHGDVERLKEQVGCNAPAGEAEIKICNLKLRQNHLPELPADFCEILKISNGFSNEDCAVFGVQTGENKHFKDVATFNVAYFHGREAKWLILGENDFFYLIYDAEQKKYHIAERDDLETTLSEDTIDEPLKALLRVE